ncbi:hypothetical protein GCM10010331_07050 [Streptomyces xanthochromogenes]|uniref:Uncharacterized protein n=1 Tax=Streptomyces xanthochromogenes TaxID=67384 RepID=A0ABQ3AVZ4_9ACTN|nr:hypothetical protein GCM10010326_70580 [Streptomyces xanthochromogenes]GHB23238.1 hypothetical protein GCM10010331_07050 [Streptomyces xanthochromogenes]
MSVSAPGVAAEAVAADSAGAPGVEEHPAHTSAAKAPAPATGTLRKLRMSCAPALVVPGPRGTESRMYVARLCR